MTENKYNHSVNIVADITDKAITFQENMIGVALETWGYCKEDVEKALLELEQYRKLGTVKEIREAMSVIKKADIDELTKIIDDWLEYQKIGAVEEVREAVEKTRAKKCIQDTCPDHTHYKCPNCGKIQMSEYKRGIRILGRITNNCDHCGQRLESEE